MNARAATGRSLALHLGVLAVLVLMQFGLPDYHHVSLARIMVLASFAMGYNLLFGYTGLLSLGHAMFFAAGMYGAGLTMRHLGWGAEAALVAGLVSALALAVVVGALALRTTGVSFMIVTLMFAQAGYLIIHYFGELTRGDEGFVIPQAARRLAGLDLSEPTNRYFAALALLALCILATLALLRAPAGRVLIAIRENEARTRMLGYDPFRYKLMALAMSGTMAGAAGALYALLFGYAGASFASIQYSIYPLLWVLLGGAGTVLGPLIGTVLMFYLIDLTSAVTSAYLLVVGVVLVGLVLFAPRGILGAVRERVAPWLP